MLMAYLLGISLSRTKFCMRSCYVTDVRPYLGIKTFWLKKKKKEKRRKKVLYEAAAYELNVVLSEVLGEEVKLGFTFQL